MRFEVRVHVSEADDFVAHVAFCRPRAVGELVGGHAGEQGFGVWNVGVAFLWDDQVAETAKDEFRGADGCAVAGERVHGGEGFGCAAFGAAKNFGWVGECVVFL